MHLAHASGCWRRGDGAALAWLPAVAWEGLAASLESVRSPAVETGNDRSSTSTSNAGETVKGNKDQGTELNHAQWRRMRWRRGVAAAAAICTAGAAAVGVQGSEKLPPGMLPPAFRAQASVICSPNAASRGQGSTTYDVAVVGGGVVGLAVAREMAVRGRRVVLLEREDAPAAGASSGNSGIGCTGYDAPVGSLERKLLRRAIQLHPALLRSFGMTYEHVRKCGSLVVAWTPEELAKLPDIIAENVEAGDSEAVLLSAAELHELEPSLSTKALGAVLCPREAVVEPWLVPAGYAHSAIINGAELRMNREVTAVDYSPVEQLWRLKTCHTIATSSGRSAPGRLLVPKPEPQPQGPHQGVVSVRTTNFIFSPTEHRLTVADPAVSGAQHDTKLSDCIMLTIE